MKIYIISKIAVMIVSIMLVANCASNAETSNAETSDDSSSQASGGSSIAGDITSNTVGSVSFNMISVPGGLTTPTATDDSTTANVANAYEIGETEVTYELWNAVYTWATAGVGGAIGEGSYTFANAGVQGSGICSVAGGTLAGSSNQHPVTCVNWRDAMIWTNALTEYYNAQNGTSYGVVYTSDAAYTTPIRTSTNSATISWDVGATYSGTQDEPYINPNTNGFRLPLDVEWELAARYKGSDSTNGAIQMPLASGFWWTPGAYASGANSDWTNFAATDVVVWFGNSLVSGTGNATNSQPVKGKSANALGLYDMSGNVWEFDFDWHPDFIGIYRVHRGGSWNSTGNLMQVGYPVIRNPSMGNYNIGFRLARSLKKATIAYDKADYNYGTDINFTITVIEPDQNTGTVDVTFSGSENANTCVRTINNSSANTFSQSLNLYDTLAIGIAGSCNLATNCNGTHTIKATYNDALGATVSKSFTLDMCT